MFPFLLEKFRHICPMIVFSLLLSACSSTSGVSNLRPEQPNDHHSIESQRTDSSTIRISRSVLKLVNDTRVKLPERLIQEWVRASAEAVYAFYGELPFDEFTVRISGFEGRGIRHGRAVSRQGAEIHISVGSETTREDFENDWRMTHELVHLTFPTVDDRHHWIEEGIATYVEPIARRMVGSVTDEQVWKELVRGLPNGLPGPDDRGLDFTPTWGRTYWGGALFCLLADIEIRKQTDGQKGLRDALQGIVAEGGRMDRRWTLKKALQVGDEATGTTVLTELHQKMGSKPVNIDLEKVWKSLGVIIEGRSTRFDSNAPLAKIRFEISNPARTGHGFHFHDERSSEEQIPIP